MPAVYAKIHSLAVVFFLLILPLSLSGCQSAPLSDYKPWDLEAVEGRVTKDPDSIPDIAWQTSSQRQILSQFSERYAAQQAQGQNGVQHWRGRTWPGQDMGQSQDQNFDRRTDDNTPATARWKPVYESAPLSAPQATRNGPVKVALLLPLSGKYEFLGQAMLKSAQMALFDVGSAGLELIPEDTKGTPDGAGRAARSVLKKGVDLILGPVFSKDLQRVKSETAGRGVPIISFSTDWSAAGDDVYVMGFLPFMQVARVARYARRTGYNRMAVFAPQTDYAEIVMNILRRIDVDVMRSQRYSPLQSDLNMLVEDFVLMSQTAFADNAAGVNFDALLLPVGGENLKALAALFDVHGITGDKVKLLGTGLWDDSNLLSTPTLYGGWYAAPDPTLRRDFEKRYKNNFGTVPPRLATLAYDATALAAVLSHTGGAPYTREKLTNRRGFAGLDGIFRFRDDGLPERGLAVLEIKKGKAVVVDPAPTAFGVSGS